MVVELVRAVQKVVGLSPSQRGVVPYVTVQDSFDTVQSQASLKAFQRRKRIQQMTLCGALCERAKTHLREV